MPTIPKKLHRIWFGSHLPEKYQENLTQLKRLNPDYELILHSDPETMSKDEYQALTAYCKDKGITLLNVREEKIENLDLIIKELDGSKSRIFDYEKRLNYTRASDLARITIIYHYGGIYTDTEIFPVRGFGVLEAPAGFLQTYYLKTEKPYIITPKGPYVHCVEYDFMAGVKGAVFFAIASEVSKHDYRALSDSERPELWLYSPDSRVIRSGMLALTGLDTLHAHNFLLQSPAHGIDKIEDTYIRTESYYTNTKDNTWMPPASSTGRAKVCDRDGETELKRFLRKSEKNRREAFPYEDLYENLYENAVRTIGFFTDYQQSLLQRLEQILEEEDGDGAEHCIVM